MAEIRPFRGVVYNQKRVKDLSQVICPPYDVISPELQEELYRRGEYNFVRIEYNKETPKDSASDNRYTRSAANIQNWLESGVLQFQASPAIYFHQHFFKSQGQAIKRDNLIVRLKLEDWESKVVRPHENIIPRAKSDRMKMLESCEANTSPVLAMYQDPQRIISATLATVQANPPWIDSLDYSGDRHKVWPIDQPEAVKRISEVIARQPLYIADGHHRYDSALTHRKQKASAAGSFTGEEGYNFVMTSLIDFADPGMLILPSHRLVRGISRAVLAGFRAQLEKLFEIEELNADSAQSWKRLDSALSGIKPDSQHVKLGVFGLEPGKLLILTTRTAGEVNILMLATYSDLYKKLDVSLVDHVILDRLLKLEKDREEGSLVYDHDRQDTINQVKNGEYQLAFLLNPVKPELIQAIADAGERMPRKSTYFYPKAPAGLVFYKW